MSQYSYRDNLLYTSKESQIYKAINKNHPSCLPYIFKGYAESCLTDPQKERKLMQELNSLWKLHGKQNILQIITQHSRDKKVFIITQFCQGGNLAQQIKKEGKFGQQKAIAYIQQIIKGYSYIYQANLIHRNLEPSSIFNAGLELKIGDFSDSIKLNEAHLAKMREEIVGNVHYQPFQTLSDYKYSIKSDVYSIGAILFCMLRGRPPYEGLNKNQILSKMKNQGLRQQINLFENPKLSQFLQKTLQIDETIRMAVDELIGYEFESMPQLNKLKLYTFDDRDSLLVQQQIGVNSKKKTTLDKIKQSSKERQLQQSLKMLFRNFDTSEKKFSAIDLKMSDEDELSKFYKDREISIFIPTKMDLPPNDDNSIDSLGLQRIESIQNRPSQGIPLRKKAGTNKDIFNNTYNDLLKSQMFSKTKLKNVTAKNLTIQAQQQLKETNAGTQKIDQTNNASKQQQTVKTVSLNITNQPQVVVPPLQFKPQKTTNRIQLQENSTKYRPKLTTERSNAKGPFTLRGRENIVSEVSKKVESKDSVIAEWLISQIDMFRFLNRVIFKIKKVSKPQFNDLSSFLQKLRSQILKDVKGFTYLSRPESIAFQNSPECGKIKEILQAYESKITESSGSFQGYQKLNTSILSGISLIFNEVSNSSQFKEDEIKLLDYLITLWQLIKLLKRNNLEQFHNKSKIMEIIDSKEVKLTMGHFLHIYERMKVLKLT